MREDAYTGSPIDDGDELSHIEDTLVGMFEFDLSEDPLSLVDSDVNEMIIHVGGVADGAKSLREAAEMLYDLADELLELSGEGWEIVDDIAKGCATAVKFEVDDQAELDLTDG